MLFAGFFAGIILASCGSQGPKAEVRSPQEQIADSLEKENKRSDEAIAALVPKYAGQFDKIVKPACPNVCRKEHDRYVDASRDSFFVEAPNGTYRELSPHSINVAWPHFRSRILGNYPTDGRERGVVFCFGLDNDLEFKLGINVVLLDGPVDNEWTYDSLAKATMYKVEKGEMVPISRDTWKTSFGDRYYQHVRVLQEDGSFRRLTPCDHLEYIMPWESELMWLGEHNKDIATSTDIVFNLAAEHSVCQLDANDMGHRQFIMGHLQGYLTNTPIPSGEGIFHRRATDLGTPCPPRCGKFVVTAEAHCSTRQNCD